LRTRIDALVATQCVSLTASTAHAATLTAALYHARTSQALVSAIQQVVLDTSVANVYARAVKGAGGTTAYYLRASHALSVVEVVARRTATTLGVARASARTTVGNASHALSHALTIVERIALCTLLTNTLIGGTALGAILHCHKATLSALVTL
jgi:hypothetical protein